MRQDCPILKSDHTHQATVSHQEVRGGLKLKELGTLAFQTRVFGCSLLVIKSLPKQMIKSWRVFKGLVPLCSSWGISVSETVVAESCPLMSLL